MGGETSKRSGEHGEEIVEKFLREIIGYSNIQTGKKLECVYKQKHAIATSGSRLTHGIDALIYGKNNLKDNNLEIGIISIKHTIDKYPTLTTFDAKFQEYFKELVYTISCFKKHTLNSEINQSNIAEGVTSSDYVGILFWLSNKDRNNDDEWNIRKRITAKATSIDNEVYDKILIVDNDIFGFLYENILTIKQTYEKVDFIYPKTGFNISSNNLGYGQKLPLLYLNSNIIPLRIEDKSKKHLYLLIKDDLTEESFISLINLAKNLNTLQTTDNTIFSFPNYNKFEHEQIVEKVLALNNIDENFRSQIKIVKHKIDFRNNE
ncbi:GapS4a family protein [Flavobacterium chilense]|uniref:GAPS4 PD-(D/E)XK nuclease domain-containing protein n=1 Tax=Flavobacterium chilense TaxID=946677 RepID=A0A1M7DUB1_9FLAO|nr:hypothetical protein [Flavobacterium chilense]SHL83101.1 hypothetical protein SAMN05444484_102729 [Flavobacterium chilense]